MTNGMRSAIGIGLAGTFALGVLVGPHITHQGATVPGTGSTPSQAAAVGVDEHQTPQAAKRERAAQHAITKVATAAPTKPSGGSPATRRSVPAAAPALHDVLKPLLNKGADMGVASQDFADAEQFALVAHAARNTDVPFMVLKHRIVEERQRLEDVIRELKPGLNAAAEANRARAEAKADVSALEG